MRILLLGFGVVARSVVDLLDRLGGDLYAEHGLAPRVVGVSDSRGYLVEPDGLDLPALLEHKQAGGSVSGFNARGVPSGDTLDLVRNCDADVVVEMTPTTIASPDRSVDHIRAALGAGKHVITVNKAPLAVAMPGLLELARYNRVHMRFSGTVGAGMPVLALGKQCAAGDRVVEARGILNGTTNYILWRMTNEGVGFDEVLADAQRLGYAETDPGADVDGWDTAVKVVIIANWVLGMRAQISDVSVQGIRDISQEQLQDAGERNMVVKLIGLASRDGLRVAPMEVERGGPMDVKEAINAVSYSLESSGDVTLVGRGAGGPETATSIIRDMVDIWHERSTGHDASTRPARSAGGW